MNTLILLPVLVTLAFLPTQAIGPVIGEKVPSFEASSTQGTVRLSDFLTINQEHLFFLSSLARQKG